jgi:putative membrane protein
VRFLLRWVANSLAFYLALYLVDSLVAPRFWIQAVWVPVVLAVLLGLLNSLIRPLPKVKTRPGRATTVALLTLLMNGLVLQIFIWAGASLSATSVVWVAIAAAFLSLLGGVINWLVGFRPREKPGAVTRQKRTQTQTTDREVKTSRSRS